MRHSAIRDTFAKIIHDVCYDVEIEPTLQLLQCEYFLHKTTTSDENARLDTKTSGPWESRFSRYFIDVKIFNPLTKSCPKNSVEAYKFHDSFKCLKYKQRIFDVEKSNFVPLVSSGIEGAVPSTTRTLKHLASAIAEKKDESYSDVLTYMSTRIIFALLRSSIICLRGSRGSKRPTDNDSFCSAIVREGRIELQQIGLSLNYSAL